MAQNTRGNRVVEPAHVAEYDRISRVTPIALTVGGVALFFVATGMTIHFSTDGLLALLSLALGTLAMAGSLGWAIKLAVANSDRQDEISRDLWAVRDVAVFDEATVDDHALYEAAGLAEDLRQLDHDNARLSQALVRTPEQERQLADHEHARHELAHRILALVS